MRLTCPVCSHPHYRQKYGNALCWCCKGSTLVEQVTLEEWQTIAEQAATKGATHDNAPLNGTGAGATDDAGG